MVFNLIFFSPEHVMKLNKDIYINVQRLKLVDINCNFDFFVIYSWHPTNSNGQYCAAAFDYNSAMGQMCKYHLVQVKNIGQVRFPDDL